MREIKFRAWDKNANKMFFDGSSAIFHILRDSIDGAMLIPQPGLFIMQYTGLKDKNGKEIYEGDIIKEPDTPNRQITFKDGSFMLTMDDGQRYLPNSGRREVIGNIYENPELLLVVPQRD